MQLTHTQIGQTLAQQNAWAANRSVTAWLQDGRVHVKNAGTVAADVPLTGTTAGASYGGQKAGWITLAPGAEQVLDPSDPANTAAPKVTGTARVGETLTADKGTWTGTPTIAYDYRWQRCAADGTKCATVPGATAAKYELAAADKGSTLRVIVLAGNWVSSVSQAASAATVVVGEAPKAESPPSSGGQGETPATPAKPGSGPSPSRQAVHAPDAAEADEGEAGSAAVRGLAQAPAQGHEAGRHAGHVQRQRAREGAPDRPAPDERQAPALGHGVHGHALGQGRERRGPPHRALRQAAAQPAGLPPRGVSGQERATAHRDQADRLPRREGLKRWPPATSTAPGASRAAQRISSGAENDSLAELHAELVLLREENARLKAAEHAGPDIEGVLGRARRLSEAKIDSDEDEATSVLVEGLAIRESLLEICGQIERVMVRFETRLRALGGDAAPQPALQRPVGAKVAHWFEPPAPTRDGSSVGGP